MRRYSRKLNLVGPNSSQTPISSFRQAFTHRRTGWRSRGRSELVDSALGQIPEGWEVCTLGDLVQFKSGFAFKSGTFKADGEHRLVTIKNVQDGSFNPKSDSCIGELPERLPPHCMLEDGDILLSLTGNLGRACLVYDGPFLLNQRVAKLEPTESLDWALTYCMFREPKMRVKLERLSTGVAQQNLSPVLASKMEYALPSSEVRQRFAVLVEPMVRFIVELYSTTQNLRRTRDLLLPRLLSGTIDLFESDAPGCSVVEKEHIAEQASLDFPLPRTQFSPAVEIERTDVADRRYSDGQLEFDSDKASPIDQTDRSDVLAVIRQVFSDGQPRTRENAIREVAQALGYGRVGHRIQDVLHKDLLTAVRRGILENAGGELRLLFRSIEDYNRDFLKQQFFAAIGRSWIERNEAIQNFCRWFGFRRTGPVIEETARSLINGLLRESRLEADGQNLIRRIPS
jgi:Type I restriction modification DNA specificity domain